MPEDRFSSLVPMTWVPDTQDGCSERCFLRHSVPTCQSQRMLLARALLAFFGSVYSPLAAVSSSKFLSLLFAFHLDNLSLQFVMLLLMSTLNAVKPVRNHTVPAVTSNAYYQPNRVGKNSSEDPPSGRRSLKFGSIFR